MPPIRIPIASQWQRSEGDGRGEKYQWWQGWGNAAQISSAAVAIFGFGAVLLQLNEIRSNNRAASARQVYLAYMDLEFRNPQLAVARLRQDQGRRSRHAQPLRVIRLLSSLCMRRGSRGLRHAKRMAQFLRIRCEGPSAVFVREDVGRSGILRHVQRADAGFHQVGMARAGVRPGLQVKRREGARHDDHDLLVAFVIAASSRRSRSRSF